MSYNNGAERIVSKTISVVATIPQPLQPVLNSDSSTGQPVAANPSPPEETPTRNAATQATRLTAPPAALDTASAAHRRANRRRGF